MFLMVLLLDSFLKGGVKICFLVGVGVAITAFVSYFTNCIRILNHAVSMKIVSVILLLLMAFSGVFCVDSTPNQETAPVQIEIPVVQSFEKDESPSPELQLPDSPALRPGDGQRQQPILPEEPLSIDIQITSITEPESAPVRQSQPLLLAHTDWSKLLAKYVDTLGMVNYKAWQHDRSALDQYLNFLSGTDLASLSRKEVIAFWINAYNAFTVKLILDHYPVQSIMDLDDGKSWDIRRIEIAGRYYSLNEIEHEILFRDYPDPRYHFALVCAARSCPPLMNTAWEANSLDSMLDVRTRHFIRDSRFNRFQSGEAAVSQLFNWYGDHFGPIISFLNKYLPTPLPPTTVIRFLEYDWSLNGR